MKRVTVIGAGVIGLSIAHELAGAGDRVTVVADADAAGSVSAVAAAVWFPYRSERSPAIDELMRGSLLRFEALAGDPASGVDLRTGTVIERTSQPDRSWAALLPQTREASDLPPGALSGAQVTVPVITSPVYLPWLRERVAERGVAFEQRTVSTLEAIDADLVVVATGLRGGELLGGDDAVFPVQGQVVRLHNPGLTDWIIDDDNPGGLTYVVPRRDDIVVGGTAVEGAWGLTAQPDVEAAILQRAAELVPALRELPVVGRAVGLRPARPTLRLEVVAGTPIPAIAAYGHGGAGVTLSWGTAERVAALSAAL